MTALIHVLLSQATGGESPLPAWVGTGVSSAFFSWLWWTERSDRKAAETRTREVLEESADRVLESQKLLSEQSAILRSLPGRSP